MGAYLNEIIGCGGERKERRTRSYHAPIRTNGAQKYGWEKLPDSFIMKVDDPLVTRDVGRLTEIPLRCWI
jgi:hypothetical protein